MAAKILAPRGLYEILKVVVYQQSMAYNTSKLLFWWAEFISNWKTKFQIDCKW